MPNITDFSLTLRLHILQIEHFKRLKASVLAMDIIQRFFNFSFSNPLKYKSEQFTKTFTVLV